MKITQRFEQRDMQDILGLGDMIEYKISFINCYWDNIEKTWILEAEYFTSDEVEKRIK